MLPLHVSLSPRTGGVQELARGDELVLSACLSQRMGVVKDPVLLIKKRGN